MADQPIVDEDDGFGALRQARDRFIEGFPSRVTSIGLLADAVDALGTDGPVHSLRQIVHRMTGLAGTIGFPTVSERASDLEQLAILSRTHHFEHQAWQNAVDALRDAFEHDTSVPPPDWAMVQAVAANAATVMVVEDDASIRELVVAWLRQGGYRPVAADNGLDAFDLAMAERPSLILLDVELPGSDGYAVCRELKTSTELSSIPVVFVTTRGGLDDKLTGLTLGADDYLLKPLDSRELLLRVARILARKAAPAPVAVEPSADVLTYEAFILAAHEACQAGPASLALVRLPAGGSQAATTHFVSEARRRDIIGFYDRSHLVVLMPSLPLSAAIDRTRRTIEAITRDGHGETNAGVVALLQENSKTIEALLAEADHALTDARFHHEPVSTSTDRAERQAAAQPASATVVIAEDDPDVSRIVDAQMRAAGYRTVMAFDGAAALEAIEKHQPALLLLDLMMPKLTGFDVLLRLGGLSTRPRVVVLSARGREDDVTRAFSLGADDYISKPFSPQELVARVARLMR